MPTGVIIKPGDFVSDIVNRYYSTADVFRKHGIDYCCGAKWSIEDTCLSKQLDTGMVVSQLNQSVNAGQFSLLNCAEWNTDFLVEFIQNIYHTYYKEALPDIQSLTKSFTDKHQKKFARLMELNVLLTELAAIIQSGIAIKENTLFPYIRRMAHAYEGKESYAGLMVRTLQKPLNSLIPAGHEKVTSLITAIKTLTDNYTPPPLTCTSHKITFYKLQQLCNNLEQQLYVEYEVLYPKALLMEKEVLLPATGKEDDI
ncbi:MAG: DUF542 domain-containing protein [Chitinophagaceae bacterium]|nr:DUF542 domain-containing protein [Chitinophagaceae bacterium]